MPGRPTLALLLTLALLVAGLPTPRPAAARADCLVFPETNKAVCGRFLDYWLANGGLARQGLPLTNAFDEVSLTNGQQYRTQYFERARFEHHPKHQGGPYEVQLGLVGREQIFLRYGPTPPSRSPGAPRYGRCAIFPATGKTVCGDFLDYWEANGGLMQLGYPLSDDFTETNPTDGKLYLTQYFERARLEYHHELLGTPHLVLSGLLGREQLQSRYPRGAPASPAPPPRPPAH
jgi:hypothetical protein